MLACWVLLDVGATTSPAQHRAMCRRRSYGPRRDRTWRRAPPTAMAVSSPLLCGEERRRSGSTDHGCRLTQWEHPPPEALGPSAHDLSLQAVVVPARLGGVRVGSVVVLSPKVEACVSRRAAVARASHVKNESPGCSCLSLARSLDPHPHPNPMLHEAGTRPLLLPAGIRPLAHPSPLISDHPNADSRAGALF